MRVSDIKIIAQQQYCQLQAQVDMDALGGKSFLLWYRFPPEFESLIDSSCGDTFLATLLLPAMVTGEPLEVEAPVSEKLFNALSTIQDIYYCWDTCLTKVAVTAPKRLPTINNARSTQAASFFSGGLDSFYTLLKHIQDNHETEPTQYNLSHLILVRGYDIPVHPEYDEFFEETLNNAREAGRAVSKEMLLISTNLRELMDLFVDWWLGHGAALGAVALTLGNLFGKIYIPSGSSYAGLIPWGSHPLLDPLWSTEELAIVHDGCEAARLKKISFIARAPVVAKYLRVCTAINSNLAKALLNCGQCEKCLRTMIGLHIAGTLELSEVFPHSIDLCLVRNLSISYAKSFAYKDLYHELGSSEKDQEIKQALSIALANSKINVGKRDVEKTGEPTYFGYRLHALNGDLAAIFSGTETIILVDEDQLRKRIKNVRLIIPFIERQKIYWGPPPDDNTAIEAVERLRQEGAEFMVIAWPAFWWLEHYEEFTQYLRFNFTCVLENGRLIVFDLKSSKKELS
jgi:hypothetical protein